MSLSDVNMPEHGPLCGKTLKKWLCSVDKEYYREDYNIQLFAEIKSTYNEYCAELQRVYCEK